MKKLRMHRVFRITLALACVLWPRYLKAAEGAGHGALPNLDKRTYQTGENLLATEQRRNGLAHLKELAGEAKVDFDPVTGSPKWISAAHGFLSGANGVGRAISANAHGGLNGADRHKSIKAFLNEHMTLFGHDASALNSARIVREFTTTHNGLHSTVWQQEVDGVPVFEAVLMGHVTQAGELVNVSSQFVPATRVPDSQKGAKAGISSRRAVFLAARNIEEAVTEEDVKSNTFPPGGRPGSEHFSARQLRGDVDIQLVWLPIDGSMLRLCWDVILTGSVHREMYRVLVDAESGEVLLRHSLTSDISNANYRVFTSDSPSPWSPGPNVPTTTQPSLVSRTLVVTNAVNTNASPNGWINDGDNETRGNNVDAHLDRLAPNDVPELPRPQGSPFRVFDFPLDLGQQPSAYTNAAIVNVFYWCNWYHDKLYELGFTESAGNFQVDNFGRGGVSGDPVQADVQDFSRLNNAQFSTPPDGMSGRMELYLFNGPTPNRDTSLDAEMILHEHTHGLSWRRVGGGVGTTHSQSAALGEGWSDFYALALLSEPSDDVDGTYAFGAYSAYRLAGIQLDNYYFGLRRYPYSTDLNRNPLTFRDIDGNQANPHTNAVRSSVVGGPASEEHNSGQVWGVALWEARANLINKYGFAVGNQLILQIVADGMSLSPPNPTFIQGRDCVIQADLVNNGGENFHELWAAFAKRGLGASATAPVSTTNVGVHEAFDLPDDLVVIPKTDVIATGPAGGPFIPESQVYTLTNLGTGTILWGVLNSANWLTISNANGTLPAGGPSIPITLSLNNKAYLLPDGVYTNSVVFSNQVSGRTQLRQFVLRVGQLDYFTEQFDSTDADLSFRSFTFYPDGSRGFYSVCQEPATAFPTDPRQGKTVSLNGAPGLPDDNFAMITLSAGARVSLYGRSTNVFFIGSNGYITFGEGSDSFTPSVSEHFRLRRVAGLLQDLDPTRGGRVSWEQLADRVAVTFENISQFFQTGPGNTNNFQFELFYDGRIRLTFLRLDTRNGIVGLSNGNGVPAAFSESDFSAYGSCSARLTLSLPAIVTEGNGVLANQGQVSIPTPNPTNLIVTLRSADTSELIVPAGVTILAGQTNALFNLTIVDDVFLDGTQVAVVSATAPQYISASGTVAVRDNESATLALLVADSVSENAGSVTVTVLSSGIVGSDTSVSLVSSDSGRLEVPPVVTIPGGSSSVSFPANLINNDRIEGARVVSITAQVDNWTSAVRSLTVTDDEPAELTLRLPVAFSESSGVLSGAGIVSLPGVAISNVVLSLFSLNEDKISVPSVVLLPAGQSNATFDLTAVNDLVADGHQEVTLVVTAPEFLSDTASVMVLDDETPPEPKAPVPVHLSTGQPLELDLRWTVAEGELIQNGDFEAGTFNGWQRDNESAFSLNDGTLDPPGSDGPLPPFAGQWGALTITSTPGRHTLYQDITIPPAAARATLRWWDRIRNHAGTFSANQQFRVELRDVDDTVLAVPFFTRPGDAPQSEWTERSFDLTSFEGQTLRVAFVQIDSAGPMNVHLDNISVVATPPQPTTFSVYFGTTAALGPGQFLGSTTNLLWHVSNLLPGTTYFWRVVANRVGQTAGGLWQFTTAGVDHFEISQAAGSQLAGQPFGVTIAAKNSAGTTVSNFSGVVHLSAGFGPIPVPVFSEDFEGPNLAGWTTNGAIATVSDATASEGTHCLMVTGGPGQALTGVRRPLPNLRPTRVSFAARAPSVSISGGAFMIGSTAAPENAVAFFGFMGGGTMGIVDSMGGTYLVSYQSNRWYHIRLDINWDQQTVDFYLDDNLVEQAAPFRGTNVSAISAIYLFNQSNTSSLWDDIQFANLSGLEALSAMPPIITNLVNGRWTGPVRVPQARLGVRLEARDENGHHGLGNAFDVLAPDDLSLDVTTSANPFQADDELAYTVRIFNSGPGSANGISLRSAWSRPVQIFSAGFSGGSCLVTESNVICDLPPLAANSTAIVSIVVSTSVTGPLTNICTLTRSESDGVLENNSFRTLTEVVAPTTVVINDTSVVEGDAGMTTAMFQLRLSSPCLFPATIFYATLPSGALSGTDFISTNGTVVFMPGITNQVIAVPVLNDLLRESNETFLVELTGAINTFIADTRATGLIIDNDALPNLLIDDAIVTEPVTGITQMLFRVTLSQPSGVPVQVGFSTANGSAVGGIDFVATNGTISIPPGETNAWLPVVINADGGVETNELFFVNLGSLVNASLSDTQAVGIIIDRVAPPCVFIDDATVVESDSAGTAALFTVSLSRSDQQTVFLTVRTQNGTAIAGEDYTAVDTLISFPPGTVTRTVSVPITGDNRNELDETFFVNVMGITNASTCRPQGVGTIKDNDPLPGLSVIPTSVTEGNLGFATAPVQVELSAPSGRTISVEFSSDDGSALAGLDYVATNGLLTFAPGVTARSIPVAIRGDSNLEASETFFVHLLRPTNAVLQTASAAVTIIDDDGAPGALSHFTWSSTPSPQVTGAAFPASLTARDVFGRVVTNFNGSVPISARLTAMDVSAGSGTDSLVQPVSAFYRTARSQIIYLANELGPARQLTGVALDIIYPPGQVLSNWTIRLKHTASGSVPVTWETAGWTTVYQTNQSIVTNGWTFFPFTAPFAYDGLNNLLVDFSFSNGTYSYDGQCRSTETGQARTLAFSSDGLNGDPLTWSGTSPTGILYSEIPNIRFSSLSLPLALQPSTTGPFNAGVWSGNVLVQTAGTNIYLWADDQNGHYGAGNTFNVLAPNSPPRFQAISHRAIDEESLLLFTITATDDETPANQLTFALLPTVPSGASISAGGTFQWQPTEAQGPGVYSISVRVTDTGNPAKSADTNFMVTVRDVNRPPAFLGSDVRIAYAGTQLSFLTATDFDVPTQSLSFSLGPGFPAGVNLNPTSGFFTWTPSEGQVGDRIATVNVADNGVPPLSSSRRFTFHVLSSSFAGIAAFITRRENSVEIIWSSQAGRNYRVLYKDSLSQAQWLELPGDVAATGPVASKLDMIDFTRSRFYRIYLLP